MQAGDLALPESAPASGVFGAPHVAPVISRSGREPQARRTRPQTDPDGIGDSDPDTVLPRSAHCPTKTRKSCFVLFLFVRFFLTCHLVILMKGALLGATPHSQSREKQPAVDTSRSCMKTSLERCRIGSTWVLTLPPYDLGQGILLGPQVPALENEEVGDASGPWGRAVLQ